MEFRVLGALTVAGAEGEVPIPGSKPKALLALLLLRPGDVVSADRLIDELWGETPPAGAANALQSQVAKVRRALGADGARLVTDAHGYRLDVDAGSIDAVRFAEQVEQGQRALATGDAAGASELLAEALTWWRGAPFDGLADEGPLRREAIRLDELHLAALEDRCDADLRLGRHAELLPELGALVDANPLRERLHGFRMLALYRAGRQAEALRAYQDARIVLGEELGLEPGEELRALEAEILAHDPGLSLPRAPVATGRGRAPLAVGLSRFIGRTAELKALGELVDTHRLVTVVGPGGAGKTRIALEVASARQARAPVWLVELAPLTEPERVADAIAGAIGVAEGALLADGGGASTIDRVAQHLGDTDALLVLDNCEHVVVEAARAAEVVLVACPRVRILATSREALGIGGENIWPVPAMAIEDAVALFVDRATGASGFALTEDTETPVNEVCTRLDGLPLAIELAAGRVRAIPVAQLASRLDDRFRLLTGGARTALPRQQTLRAVVEWSYDLLFDDERRVFERLSVFAGGCTLEGAEAVCPGDDLAAEDVADLLAHLVDKSLVVADHSSGEARFHLLQTLALYGREQLAASGAAEATRARHAAHYGVLCERGWAAFRGEAQVAWLAEVNREADNLRVALRWTLDRGDAETAQTMLGGLGWSYWFSGRAEEGWRFFVAALSLPSETEPSVRAAAAMWACYVGYAAGIGMDLAIAYGEEAVALARDAGDARRLAEATMLLAGANIGAGDIARAIELFEASHRMFSGDEDLWGRALSTNAKGRAAALRGELDVGERLMTESVGYFEAAGVEWAKALVNDDIAQLAEDRGDIVTATAGMERAREAARELYLGGADALFTARLGNYALIQGDIERADALHTEALALGEAVGFPRTLAFTYNGRAMVRRATGDLDEAAEWAERVRVMCHQSRDLMGEALGLASLGFVAERQGDLAGARARHEEALALAQRMGQPVYLALAIEGLAGVAAAERDGERAAALLGSAHALRATKGGAPAGPASDVERITAAAVDLVGADGFAAEFARGEVTPYEELLDPLTSA